MDWVLVLVGLNSSILNVLKYKSMGSHISILEESTKKTTMLPELIRKQNGAHSWHPSKESEDRIS
jgi:hypothetical protein